MKKMLYVLLTLIVVCSFTACVDDPQKETYQSDSSVTESSSKEENFGINETAVFENLKVTATEIKETKGSDFFTPEEGNVFVGIKFEIENISSEEQSVSSLLMFDGYADDVKCSYSFSAACAFDEGTLDGTILPGKKLIGWYALEVSEGWSSIDLVVNSSWLSDSKAVFEFAK